MSEFFARNWGKLASVVGLVFGALAFVFLKGASQAAKEARNSVLRRSLGEDMNGLNRAARDIETYVGLQRGETAFYSVSELVNRTGYVVRRWESKLSRQSRDDLPEAGEQLKSIHAILANNSIAEIGPQEKAGMTQPCQRVS